MVDRGISQMARRLRQSVGRFVTRDALYKRHLLTFFDVFKRNGWPAVIFGGTLRDLLLHGSAEQPRDVDVVVDVPSIDTLMEVFSASVKRRTRYGGLHLYVGAWPVDLWPLTSTWAFQDGRVRNLGFCSLPSTTFLNVEAVAVDLWPQPLHGRRIYERGFFDAVSNRTLDVNWADNPFPELCVVRSLVTAAKLDFSISPRLRQYIVDHGRRMSAHDLEVVQTKHYGKPRCPGVEVKAWIGVLERGDAAGGVSFRIPVDKAVQLSLWEDWVPSC